MKPRDFLTRYRVLVLALLASTVIILPKWAVPIMEEIQRAIQNVPGESLRTPL